MLFDAEAMASHHVLYDILDPAVQVPQSSNLSHVLPYLLKLAISDPQLYWRLGAALVAMILSKSAGEITNTHPQPHSPILAQVLSSVLLAKILGFDA